MAHSKEYTRLDDEDIVALVDQNVRSSVGYYSSDLSREREKVLNYYNAKLPKPHHEGNSKYISQDVYSAVQSMQAALLETFAAGNRIVRFAPQNQDDVQTAAVLLCVHRLCPVPPERRLRHLLPGNPRRPHGSRRRG